MDNWGGQNRLDKLGRKGGKVWGEQVGWEVIGCYFDAGKPQCISGTCLHDTALIMPRIKLVRHCTCACVCCTRRPELDDCGFAKFMEKLSIRAKLGLHACTK